MYNRVQQRFDRSIAKAIEETKRANDAKPRRNVRQPRSTVKEAEPKGRLYLCPETGATVWEPARSDATPRRG
jgi:hypothetical protein